MSHFTATELLPTFAIARLHSRSTSVTSNFHWEDSSRFFILLRPALLCYEPMDELTPQIMAEIIRAIVRLRGDPKVLPESPRQDQLLDLLRHLGADRYLIGTVASWKDTIDDQTALDDLRRLNEGRSFFDDSLPARMRSDRTQQFCRTECGTRYASMNKVPY